ncbi:hypothetical protein ACFL14_02380 [Patescibacteria group bacterium]
MENSSEDKVQEVKTAQTDSGSKPEKKSNIGMIVIIVVAVLVVLGVGGYFASRYFFSSWFENQTGISVDEDGDSAKIETDDGEPEVGDSLTLPSYWPDDVPIYAKDNISTVGKNGEDDFYLSFISGSSTTEIFDWYIEEIEDDGWTVTSQLTLETGSNISAEKDTRLLSVIILNDEDSDDTTTAITVGPKN